MSDKPKAELRARLVDRKLVEALPSNFSAGCPKAALLFLFIGVLDVVLFIVIPVIY